MRRREFSAFTAAALLAPRLALAQGVASPPRVGLLWIRAPGTEGYIAAFRDGLRSLGYTEGRTVFIEERFMADGYDALPGAAARLAAAKVSVIVTYGSTAVEAVQKAAPSIANVMVSGGDPVKLGFATTLSRPGGNVTGLAAISVDLSGKRLELLRELVPSARRLVMLLVPSSSSQADAFQRYEAAARPLGLQLRRVEIRNPAEIESSVRAVAATDAQAVIVAGSTMFNANRARVLAAVGKLHLPAVYASSEYVDEGGLVAYGMNIRDAFRRAAVFVDKILKGAKPGDLPIEQPTTIELALNLRTASALGIRVPQSVRVRADRVIE